MKIKEILSSCNCDQGEKRHEFQEMLQTEIIVKYHFERTPLFQVPYILRFGADHWRLKAIIDLKGDHFTCVGIDGEGNYRLYDDKKAKIVTVDETTSINPQQLFFFKHHF